jgi:stage II sporulation protein AA (anti-sigma F factor antagonist)
MKMEFKRTGGRLTVGITGELDESNAVSVRTACDELIDKSEIVSFIMDFRHLRFMDSTGLGVILGRYKKLKARNIEMHICNPQPQVLKVILTAGLNEIINII